MSAIINEDLVDTLSGQESTTSPPISNTSTGSTTAWPPNITLPKKTSPLVLSQDIEGNTVGSFIYIIQNSIITHSTNKFYLTSLQLPYKERVQLLETFGSANISFFGDSIKVYQFGGVSVDHESQFPGSRGSLFHLSSIIDLYNEHMRGTKLIENNSIAVLKVKNHLIYGYPISLNVSYSAEADKMGQFALQMVVTKHELNALSSLNGGTTALNSLYTASESLGNDVISTRLTLINEALQDLNFLTDQSKGLMANFTNYSSLKEKEQSKYKANLSKYLTNIQGSMGESQTFKKYFSMEKITTYKTNFEQLKTQEQFISVLDFLSILNNIKNELSVLQSVSIGGK